MRKTITITIIIFAFTAFGFIYFSPGDKYKVEGEKHLANIKMLTGEGQNAEAYLSFDEKKLIFQRSAGDIECDQIFIMNLDGSDKKMVSIGKGKTTCSYFLPGDERIIYSSTHLVSDDCPPVPDFSKGYVWKLYESYDIFSAND